MVSYEWCIELLDGEDIIDSQFESSLKELVIPEEDHNLCLVRREGSEEEGETDRCEAYVIDGLLPDYFSDTLGNEIGYKVPVKYKNEFNKHRQTNI